ncbi:MAG: threonine/serine exporter family protein [Caldicoprobacterales bacterium]|nr:threonine/serine exporter family protein [Clostridiales bacterium]
MEAASHKIGEIMDIACRAGKITLENGGEIYRVEETMLYICRGFGMKDSECYATPTSIIVSISDTMGEVHTRMIRISSRGINLRKVEAVNVLSREIMSSSVSITEAKTRLTKINNTPAYPLWLTTLAAGTATSAFTIIFGGGLVHFLFGLIVGAVLNLAIALLNRIELGYFTTNLFGGAIAAFGGWLLYFSGSITNWWIITFAALMQLVPGLLFTNALRDMVAGDFVSGISRGGEAFSIAAALAGGVAITLMILTRLGLG